MPALGCETSFPNLESMGLTSSTVSQLCYTADPGNDLDGPPDANLMMLINPRVNQAYDTIELI